MYMFNIITSKYIDAPFFMGNDLIIPEAHEQRVQKITDMKGLVEYFEEVIPIIDKDGQQKIPVFRSPKPRIEIDFTDWEMINGRRVIKNLELFEVSILDSSMEE